MGHYYKTDLRIVIKLSIASLINGLTPENLDSVIGIIVNEYVYAPPLLEIDDDVDIYEEFYKLQDKKYDYVICKLGWLKTICGNFDIFLGLNRICEIHAYGYQFTGTSHGLVSIPTLQEQLDNPYTTSDQEIKYKIITDNFQHEITMLVCLCGG